MTFDTTFLHISLSSRTCAPLEQVLQIVGNGLQTLCQRRPLVRFLPIKVTVGCVCVSECFTCAFVAVHKTVFQLIFFQDFMDFL